MNITPDVEIAAVAIALIAYAAYREWLRHERRVLIHKERLAAIEKGVEVQMLEQEQQRSSWNVQRTLLLAGLIWISIGLCMVATLSAVAANNSNLDLPHGIDKIGIGPIAIGISHLIVLVAGRSKGPR